MADDKGKDEEDNGVKERSQKRRKAVGGSLGEALASESGGSAASWVKKLGSSKNKSILARFDEEEEQLASRQAERRSYAVEDMAGLRVMHDMKDLGDGEDVILTLADRNVLDEGDEVLQSAHLVQLEKQRELERYKKTKGKPVYDVFDHDAPLLPQYQDEPQPASFVLGAPAADSGAALRLSEVRARAAREAKRLVYDASASQSKVASDYMTQEEMASVGKKDKKKEKKDKKKQRRGKKLTSDLLEELAQQQGGEEDDDAETDRGSASTAGGRRKEKTEEGRLQGLLEKEARYKAALQNAMKKTKAKLYEDGGDEDAAGVVVKVPPANGGKQRETVSVAEKLAQRAREKREKEKGESGGGIAGGLVFTSATEFVKHIKAEEEQRQQQHIDDQARQEMPAVKLEAAVKKEAEEEKADLEDGEIKAEVEEGEVEPEPERGLEEEPDVGQGLAATLHYLKMHGAAARSEPVVARLQDGSVNKRHRVYDQDDDDEPGEGKKARGGAEELPRGAKVDLQKYDEFGRPVSRKEAFRLMSQGFHGNASGARKQEKRLKQVVKEKQAKHKQSTESTLKTLDQMEKRQKEMGTAGIDLGFDSAQLEDMQEQTALAAKQKIAKKAAKKK